MHSIIFPHFKLELFENLIKIYCFYFLCFRIFVGVKYDYLKSEILAPFTFFFVFCKFSRQQFRAKSNILKSNNGSNYFPF